MRRTLRALNQASHDLYRGGHWASPRLFARMWIHGLLNFRSISRIYTDAPYGNISEMLTDEPHFLGLLVWPLVDARWTPKQRLQALVAHYREAASLGDLLRLDPRQIKSVLKLDALLPTLEVCVENQPWFNREGQCTLSLFHEGARVYSVAFLLSREQGKRVAYVGAVQGVKQPDDSTTYKALTKAAHGLRPRDLSIAMFLLLCKAMHVEHVLAIKDSNRQHQHSYFDASQRAEIFANYDHIWTENGATLRADGQYTLQSGIRRKDLSEVPSKKRAMYRKREVFLEACLASLQTRAQSSMQQNTASSSAPHGIGYPQHPAPKAAPPKGKTLIAWVPPAFWGSWLWSFPALFM